MFFFSCTSHLHTWLSVGDSRCLTEDAHLPNWNCLSKLFSKSSSPEELMSHSLTEQHRSWLIAHTSTVRVVRGTSEQPRTEPCRQQCGVRAPGQSLFLASQFTLFCPGGWDREIPSTALCSSVSQAGPRAAAGGH